jgi:hypothetical protein
VVAQARREGIALSDAEITMLGFAEETATEQELAAARRFDDEVDDRVYEAKISELLAQAYRYAKQNGETAAWDDALVDLSEIDCYLIVMANQAGILNSSRGNSLLEWGFSLPQYLFCASSQQQFLLASLRLVHG